MPNIGVDIKKEVLESFSMSSLKEFISDIDSVLGEPPAASSSIDDRNVHAATGASYRALSTLVKSVDADLLHAGCERVVVDDLGSDSAVEWVSSEALPAFTSKGKQFKLILEST